VIRRLFILSKTSWWLVSVLLGTVALHVPIVPAEPDAEEIHEESVVAAKSVIRPPTVCEFGAVGDGKADDSEAFQRAVHSGQGNVLIPRGTYRLTRPVVIDLDRVGPVSLIGYGTAKILMEGPGAAFKLIGTHEGTAAPETVKENVWQRQRMPVVTGLEIVGGHAEACGIEAAGTMQATFSRVLIRKTLHGIHLIQRNRNVVISDCHIYENDGIGIFLDTVNLHQINITNSHISYNGGGGIVVRGGEVRNLQVGNCDIEGNMNPEAPPTANVLLDAREGSVREAAIVGCTIQHSHEAPGSANICLLGRGPEDDRKIGNLTIANNVLSDVAVNIHIRDGRGGVISGNTFWKGFSHNLLVERSSNVVLGPNLFDRNPDYTPADSRNGLLFRDCVDCTLTGLHIGNTLDVPAGLVLERCRRFNVTDCSILNCDGCGILLEDVEHVRVSDCLIVDVRPENKKPIALRLTKGRNNMVLNNLVNGEVEIAPGSARVANSE
jgi:hypothetical protein